MALTSWVVKTDPDEPANPPSVLANVQIRPEDASSFFEMLDDAWQWVVTDPDAGKEVDESESPAHRRLRRAAVRTGKGLASAGVFVVKLALLATLVQEHGPANWNGLVGFHAALTLMGDDFPAAWVPDTETLDALARAVDRPSRQAILLDRRDAVLAHARTVLAEVSAPDLGYARRLAEQALACVTAFPAAAQSLALNAAVVIALGETGLEKLAYLNDTADERAELLRRHEYQRLVTDLPASLLLLTVAPTLRTFRPWRGDPVPTRPNRHAVAHSVSPCQFTEGNALESVLLAVSVLRQAQRIRTERAAAESTRAGRSPAKPDRGSVASAATPAGTPGP